jgi:hypothetical protein
MSDKNIKRKENNRLRDWRRKNREEAKVTIVAQQSITQNRWRGLGTIFNSIITYQVFQLVEKEVVITIVQINVEEVNGLTSDGVQQTTQMNLSNVDHEYQKPTRELNMLLFNTL